VGLPPDLLVRATAAPRTVSLLLRIVSLLFTIIDE
jgi:hypothetical protein